MCRHAHIGAHMGPVCGVYGLAHIVKPIKDPYQTQLIWASPQRTHVGLDTKPKWAQCWMYTALPILVRPYRTHTDKPIWAHP